MKLNYKDFNTLTLKEMCKLPGIGRTGAKRVCSMRPFKENNDLFKVKGLGKKTLNNLGIEKKKKERKWKQPKLKKPQHVRALKELKKRDEEKRKRKDRERKEKDERRKKERGKGAPDAKQLRKDYCPSS